MSYKYQIIRDRVLEAALKSQHDSLPSEHEICAMYQVSRSTAIKALNSLRDAKLVRREVGRGTFLNRKRLQTQVHLLISRISPDLVTFAQELSQQVTDLHPDIALQVHPIDTADWVKAIATRPGTKLICCSHTGFLSRMGMLAPLQQLPGFSTLLETIGPSLITWRQQPDASPRCDAIPFMLTPEVMAINRTMAGDLGLPTDRGPQSWSELSAWAIAAVGYRWHGHPIMGAPIKQNNLLPLSYLLMLNGGRTFLQGVGNATSFLFDRGEEWLSLFKDLHRRGAMPLYTTSRPNPIFFGISLLAPWTSTWLLSEKNRFNCADDLGVHPIPPPDVGQPTQSLIGRSEVALIRNEKPNPTEEEAAWRIIRYLVADSTPQTLLTKQFSCLSVHRQVLTKQSQNPAFRPFITALERGIPRNDHPAQHQIMRVLSRYFYPCVLGDLSVKEAASKIRVAAETHLDLLRSESEGRSAS